MKYRKLRIAWSVACGVLCLLLVALWVRSYWQRDRVSYDAIWSATVVELLQGTIYFSHIDFIEASHGYRGWEYESLDVAEHGGAPPFEFYWEWFSSDIDLVIPLWFAVAAFAAFGVTLWLRWRFSLRTLLIGTTMVALLLGLILWASRGS